MVTKNICVAQVDYGLSLGSKEFLEYMLNNSKPTDSVVDWLEDYYFAMTI